MRVAAGIVLACVFIGALAVATLREAAVHCEACFDFEGQRACRSGTGADREAAVQSARNAACAALASGVTRGMQCQRTPPSEASCAP